MRFFFILFLFSFFAGELTDLPLSAQSRSDKSWTKEERKKKRKKKRERKSSKESDQEFSVLIREARDHIGVRYKYGGEHPKSGFDCSGFVQYVFLNGMAIRLPRTSREQSKVGQRISMRKIKEGDLLFFASKGKINHVGIALIDRRSGDLLMIHSTSSKGVMITNVTKSTYWKPRMKLIRRVVK